MDYLLLVLLTHCSLLTAPLSRHFAAHVAPCAPFPVGPASRVLPCAPPPSSARPTANTRLSAPASSYYPSPHPPPLQTATRSVLDRAAHPWDVLAAVGALPLGERTIAVSTIGAALSQQLEALVAPLCATTTAAPPVAAQAAQVEAARAERNRAEIALAGPRLTALVAALYGVVHGIRATSTVETSTASEGSGGVPSAPEVDAALVTLAGIWRAQLMLWVSAEVVQVGNEAVDVPAPRPCYSSPL